MKLDPTSPSLLLPAATVILLIIYLVTLQPIVAILCLAAFLSYVALDFITGAKAKGRSSLLEVVYAVIGAALVWFALSLALHTPSPLDVVTSCSMNNYLNRGDLVVVQGQEMYNAPVIEYRGQLPAIRSSKANCLISKRGSADSTTQCTANLTLSNFSSTLTAPVDRSSVTGNDVIIFESNAAGLVIHRTVLALRDVETGKMLYLTKGDNNQVLDQEAGIDAVELSKIHGRLIARVPLVGYLRLFLAGQFAEPRGCDTLIS